VGKGGREVDEAPREQHGKLTHVKYVVGGIFKKRGREKVHRRYG